MEGGATQVRRAVSHGSCIAISTIRARAPGSPLITDGFPRHLRDRPHQPADAATLFQKHEPLVAEPCAGSGARWRTARSAAWTNRDREVRPHAEKLGVSDHDLFSAVTPSTARSARQGDPRSGTIPACSFASHGCRRDRDAARRSPLLCRLIVPAISADRRYFAATHGVVPDRAVHRRAYDAGRPRTIACTCWIGQPPASPQALCALSLKNATPSIWRRQPPRHPRRRGAHHQLG